MASDRCCPGILLFAKCQRCPVWQQLCHRWPPGPSGKQCKQPRPGNATTVGCLSHSQPGTRSWSGHPMPSRRRWPHGRDDGLNPTSTSGTCCLGHRRWDSSLPKPPYPGTSPCSSAGWWKHPHLLWWDQQKTPLFKKWLRSYDLFRPYRQNQKQKSLIKQTGSN